MDKQRDHLYHRQYLLCPPFLIFMVFCQAMHCPNISRLARGTASGSAASAATTSTGSEAASASARSLEVAGRGADIDHLTSRGAGTDMRRTLPASLEARPLGPLTILSLTVQGQVLLLGCALVTGFLLAWWLA